MAIGSFGGPLHHLRVPSWRDLAHMIAMCPSAKAVI
nr:MAG TPA: hypothetical protein [Caudoviricetes sp.]